MNSLSVKVAWLRVVGVLLVALLPLSAAAQNSLYGVTFFNNELITINPTTGEGTLVGPLGVSNPYGIANRNGSLYTFDANSQNISQINPATGGTLNSINIGVSGLLGEGDLAFRSDGTGFLASALDANFNPVNDLYSFDVSNGTSMLVGHTSATLTGLAFDAGGTLYGLGKNDGNLYTIDPTTAALTLVGNVGVSVGSPIGALTFAPDGTLFAALDDQLYSLDKATGAGTLLDPNMTGLGIGFSSVSGLAFAPTVVPEPGLLAFVVAAGLPGLLVLRRRKPHAAPFSQ